MVQGSLSGRSCVVTGATSGIGEETALELARRGARVVAIGRSRERGERSLGRIRSAIGGGDVELLLADLASLSSVRRLAEELLARLPAIHVLVNNAGVAMFRRTTSVDGLETTFAVNHLAPFLLTLLLLDRIVASAPARIVNVASHAHRLGPPELADLQSVRRYRGMRAYGRSKSANVLFTYELARRLEGTGVTANCVHPGAVATRLGTNNGRLGRLAMRLLAPFLLSPAEGAEASLRAASAPELEGVSGRYLTRRGEARSAPHTHDAELAARLWRASVELAGLGS